MVSCAASQLSPSIVSHAYVVQRDNLTTPVRGLKRPLSWEATTGTRGDEDEEDAWSQQSEDYDNDDKRRTCFATVDASATALSDEDDDIDDRPLSEFLQAQAMKSNSLDGEISCKLQSPMKLSDRRVREQILSPLQKPLKSRRLSTDSESVCDSESSDESIGSVEDEEVELCRRTLASLPEPSEIREYEVEESHKLFEKQKQSLFSWPEKMESLAPTPQMITCMEQAAPEDDPPPPSLGPKEWLQDDHFTYMIKYKFRAPEHVWLATPAQVLLLQSGQDTCDRFQDRDGSLQCLWDNSRVRTLLLPINDDVKAGRDCDAGTHWSLLVVRRGRDSRAIQKKPRKSSFGTSVEAKLIDSLAKPSLTCSKIAAVLLRSLASSKYWSSAPRRPELCGLGLQRDNYQCGIFCLLAIRRELLTEEGNLPSGPITPLMVRKLRAVLCNSAAAGA